MWSDFPLFPAQASTVAGRVDALYLFLVALSAFFSLLIGALIVFFAIRYRRRKAAEVGASIHGSTALELIWTGIPLIIVMGIFVWSGSIFMHIWRIPDNALDVYAVGKQWMWKFQHPDGRREINELHVPVGRAVRLTMGSEDVIHSLYVPAFRVKADVVPGRTTRLWFQATTPGRYRLFCAEYCGTNHSGMVGWVYVMEPAEFDAWLGGAAGQGSMASAGEKLFGELACATCHRIDSEGRGPVLDGLFGSTVKLAGGATVVANEDYLHESILNPTAKMVDGYPPLMPTFQGLISEDGLLQLMAYIKSIGPREAVKGRN
jgi:cytochrome c oxidase subunit II